MTTLHIRNRLRGLRTAHTWRRVVLRTLTAALLLAAAVAAMAWAENTLAALDSAKTKAIKSSYKVSQLEQTWVSCLENKAVWIGDELHTCSLLNTRLSKGDF